MNGKIIYTVHKCVPPKIKPQWGKGTLWECECMLQWQLIDMFDKLEWQTSPYVLLLNLRRSGSSNRKIYKQYPWLKDVQRTVWFKGDLA